MGLRNQKEGIEMTKDKLVKETEELVSQANGPTKKLNGLPWVLSAAPILIQVNVLLDKLKATKDMELEPLKALVAQTNKDYEEAAGPLREVDVELRQKVLEEYDGTDAIESEGGELVFPERWSYEVVDFSKVERKNLMVSGPAINELIRKGARKIRGIKVWKKRGLTVKKNK